MEKKELDLFNPTKAELQVLVAQYKDLKINGIDDKVGFKNVHEAQMKLRDTRVTISKTRKAFTDPKNAEIKQAIALEKEILWIITPIEDSLKEQKNAIEAEKEKIKEVEAEKKRKFLQNRVDELAKFDYVHHDLFELSQFNDEFFQELLWKQKAIFQDKEEKRKSEEENTRLYNLIREINHDILRAKTVDDIEKAEQKAKENKIEITEEIQDTINNKKSMILHEEEKRKFEQDKKNQEEKLATDQKNIDDQNKKIQDDKDKIENDKIEAKRKKDEDERVAKERKEAAEQATKDAEKAAEEKRIADEEQKKKDDEEKKRKEKENQEKLEKETKYKDFLKKNEWKYDWFFDKDWKRILYKIIDEFNI